MGVKYFILMLYSLIVVNSNQCGNNTNVTKITVIGIAFVYKNQAGVQTDDSLLYYLYGIPDWDVKYKGEKVKVTGELMKLPPRVTKHPDPNITISLQPRIRNGEYIKNAKWRLVE